MPGSTPVIVVEMFVFYRRRSNRPPAAQPTPPTASSKYAVEMDLKEAHEIFAEQCGFSARYCLW